MHWSASLSLQYRKEEAGCSSKPSFLQMVMDTAETAFLWNVMSPLRAACELFPIDTSRGWCICSSLGASDSGLCGRRAPLALWQAGGPGPTGKGHSSIPLLNQWTWLVFLNFEHFQVVFSFLLLYIVVILKHFSLWFVFFFNLLQTNFRWFAPDLVRSGVFFYRGGWGWQQFTQKSTF